MCVVNFTCQYFIVQSFQMTSKSFFTSVQHKKFYVLTFNKMLKMVSSVKHIQTAF